jgi:hypothetical protein
MAAGQTFARFKNGSKVIQNWKQMGDEFLQTPQIHKHHIQIA